MSWDPTQYLAFADHRQRPAVDLLSHISLLAPATVYDLGCGPGTMTKLLRKRFPAAIIVGVDGSDAMLARAATLAPGNEWLQADIASWTPRQPADLIFSNAALHWLDQHQRLLPQLMGYLTPGGVLAVQMPRNHGAPSHTGIAESISAGPWADRLKKVRSIQPVGTADFYYDILANHAATLDIWESDYLQVLEGHDPVVEWTKGTVLKPYLDALTEAERPLFLADYSARMQKAYPPQADGRTLFPFRRLFIIATRT